MKESNSSLRKDYTYDQFIRLSQLKPDTDTFAEQYYRLEMTEMADAEPSYPAFKVGPTHIIDFPTFDSAVCYMETHSGEMNLYRSRITQYPLQEDTNERAAQWLYDPNGKLLDCTIVQKVGSPEETGFFGRPLEQQRFKPDDVAYGLDLPTGDSVRVIRTTVVMERLRLMASSKWSMYFGRNRWHNKRSASVFSVSSSTISALPTAMAE